MACQTELYLPPLHEEAGPEHLPRRTRASPVRRPLPFLARGGRTTGDKRCRADPSLPCGGGSRPRRRALAPRPASPPSRRAVGTRAGGWAHATWFCRGGTGSMLDLERWRASATVTDSCAAAALSCGNEMLIFRLTVSLQTHGRSTPSSRQRHIPFMFFPSPFPFLSPVPLYPSSSQCSMALYPSSSPSSAPWRAAGARGGGAGWAEAARRGGATAPTAGGVAGRCGGEARRRGGAGAGEARRRGLASGRRGAQPRRRRRRVLGSFFLFFFYFF